MIPTAFITHWRREAPWPQDAQVEQDLILCRALVELFQHPELSASVRLRGGTALHKLYIPGRRRYSEDIDLVQVEAGPIGAVIDAVRAKLDPWLGRPRRGKGPDTVTLRYGVPSEIPPVVPLRLKVEINTREHFIALEPAVRLFEVWSPWFEGKAEIQTFTLEELLATKLRALYQRRKGRDLFDLLIGLRAGAAPEHIATAFRRYFKGASAGTFKEKFTQNLTAKLDTPSFEHDLRPLLAPGIEYDPSEAGRLVQEKLIAIL